jgi:hypothetical protein
MDAWFRQASTVYAVGDMRCYESLPYGWYLECTTAGTTGSSDITIPSPLDVGDTVTDGTVVWTIRKIGSGDGFAIGDIKQIAHNGTIQDGWLECDGRAVSRTMFPDLFDAIGTTYGAGDGSTTFNLPSMQFLLGVQSQLPQDSTVPVYYYYDTNTRFTFSGYGPSGQVYAPTMRIDSSVPDYNISSHSPQSQMFADLSGASVDSDNQYSQDIRYIIKAYDGVTPTPSQADISEMLTELTGKADRDLDNLSADGENHFLENDFTIIYPNGGSEASPANVTTNSRYVETNPFPGYYVKCEAEMLFNSNWAAPFFDGNGGTGSNGYGIMASQLNDNSIIVQTGATGVSTHSNQNGAAFGDNSSTPTSAPCRVKVWKIGKIPT